MDKFKLWLFPALVSILATVIYREVLEIRTDVKQLLAQSNVDKTKIEILEQQVKTLNTAVFMNSKVIFLPEEEAEKHNKKWIYTDSMILSKEEDYYTINDRIMKDDQ